MKQTILKIAALNALGTAAYVVLVATFLSYTPQLFGTVEEKTMFIPIAMIMLLICSATFTGSLVLGRPILWYLDGKKKEAVSLFISTVAFLFILMIIAFFNLALLRK